jgi:hypothetical protein
MSDEQKEVIKKIGEEKIIVLIVVAMIIIALVMANFDSAKEYINTDFDCSVHEYYQGNYSKALTEINNSAENSIEKKFIRGLINYQLNKYQESLSDLNTVSQNMKVLNTNLYTVNYKNIFSENKYYSLNILSAFIITHKIKSECKFYLNDFRGAIIDSDIALDTLVKYQKEFNNDFLKNTYTSLHYYKAISKFKLKNYEGSLFSLNETIKFNGANNHPKTYLYKGLIEIQNKNKDSACISFSKAGELGCEEAYPLIKKYCNQ